MNVIRGLQPASLATSVVTLGMFDGVHRGHQALLRACRDQADRRAAPAVALTYEPHPSWILRRDHATKLLTPLPEKLTRLAAYGMDVTVVAEFTPEFSQLSPEDYIARVVEALHPQAVVVGYRTTFGHARAGTAAVLRELGERCNFVVDIAEPVAVAGSPVSSTRIRQALEDGDVTLAAELLGYTYQVTGAVMHGDARGRTLGIPTANLEVDPVKLLPADGVYAVAVDLPAGQRRAVMNIGNRPTFDRPPTLEVHILDFTGDLYGQTLTVTFLSRLRAVCTFASVDALVTQIHEDIRQARQLPG